MPALIAALWGAFLTIIPTLVGRVLIAAGIGYVAYSGIDGLVNSARSSLFASISASYPVVVQLAGVLKIGTCINIMTSAVLARLALAGITNGLVTKFVNKG